MRKIHLQLIRNSVCNTTISCDSLGIYYEVSKPKGDKTITVERWRKDTNTNVLIGQFCLPILAEGTIKLAGDQVWRTMEEFLRRGHGVIWKTHVFSA